MTETSSIQGSVLLRKLRTGQTAQVSISTTKQLFQLYTETNGVYKFAPDWTTDGNAPVCSVNVVGSGLTLVSVTWYINGTLASSLPKCSVSGNALTIARNIAADMGYVSGTLKATIALIDAAGNKYSIDKTEEIRVQKAVDGGWVVMIDANQTYVDASSSATLKATVYANMTKQEIGSNGVTVNWFKGNATTTVFKDTASITVTASDINGSQAFVCRAYCNGTEMDAESVTVIDNSDPYHITANCTTYASTTDTSGSTQEGVTSVNVGADYAKSVVTFKVVDKNNTENKNATNWKCRKMHADTMKYISGSSATASYTSDTSTDNATSGNSMTVYDGDYVSISGGTSHDTEVVVEAECEI